MINKAAVLLVLTSWLGVSSAATVDVVPSLDTLMIGDTVEVIVSASDFPATGGATLGINWDASVLTLVQIAPVDFLFVFPGTPSTQQIAAGSIEPFTTFASTNPADDPVGTFDAFVMTFTAAGFGISAVSLGEDVPDGGWKESDGTTIADVIYNQASISVVPVPAALWLFLSALGALSLRRTPATAQRS